MSCVWCKGRELMEHDCANFAHFTEEDMEQERLERTDEAQRDFDARLGGPMRVPNGMTTKVTTADSPSRFSPAKNGAAMDPFADDTPIEAACDLENPESCESCT